MASSWGLKGKLGLARLEKGRVLLEFEFVEEAIRVLTSGKRSVGGLHAWSTGVQGLGVWKKVKQETKPG